MKSPSLKPKMDVQAKPQAWSRLSAFTQARIALGHTGVSLPTKAQLKFNVDHALARDAVNTPLDTKALALDLQTRQIQTLLTHSAAANRTEYLQRPDLGRRLSHDAKKTLTDFTEQHTANIDVAIVLVDGLSSIAVQRHSADLVASLLSALKDQNLTASPAIIVEQGRVAIGDEIGESLKARSVVLIVGERPGLSSPDSLGIYYTYAPKLGLNDAKRNCISNIRPAGLSIDKAVSKTIWLVQQSFKRELSGVALKDTSQQALEHNSQSIGNFLLPKP